jgi:lipid II:glycine glycyltransferase (peptidoglycan interpeptide bridge formation enzyme)
MGIVVQEIRDKTLWNDFLARHSRGHLLQSYQWGELNTYLGGRLYRLGALDGDRLVGALSLTVGSVPLPLPLPGPRPCWLYSSRGPTIEGVNVEALGCLVERVHSIARQERAVVVRVEPNIADDDPEMGRWLALYHRFGFRSNPAAIHGRRSWVLDIRPSAEELLANFKMTWRQNVRTAERKGVVVRAASSEADFEAYYALLKLTSERDAFFIHGPDYHREIMRQFADSDDIALFLAEHEGQVLAAKMLIRLGNWCWDMFGASANEKRNLKATYLLQYRSLQWAQAQGCHFFDFRTIPEVLEPGAEMWGVYEYKRGFGGFSRLNIPTQDYVYRPLIYTAWRQLVELRRARRQRERRLVEMARLERGKGESLERDKPTPKV